MWNQHVYWTWRQEVQQSGELCGPGVLLCNVLGTPIPPAFPTPFSPSTKKCSAVSMKGRPPLGPLHGSSEFLLTFIGYALYPPDSCLLVSSPAVLTYVLIIQALCTLCPSPVRL